EALWVADIDGALLTRVAELTGVERGIAWSPDGTQVAVTSYQPGGAGAPGQIGHSALIVVAANGSATPVTVLTGSLVSATGEVSGEWTDGPVTWTRDGLWLIYRSSPAAEYPSAAIREIAPSGGPARLLVEDADSFDLGGS